MKKEKEKNRHNEGETIIILFLCKSTAKYEIFFKYNNKYVGSPPRAECPTFRLQCLKRITNYSGSC